MAVRDAPSGDEQAIRDAIARFAKAIHDKDADAVAEHMSPDIVSFDLAPPLQIDGADRKGFIDWFATWSGPIDYEVTRLHVEVSGDLAFTRSINRMAGTKTDGEKPEVWVRSTLALRKTGGGWKVVHAHTSVPFYMDGSFKAAVDLKPGG